MLSSNPPQIAFPECSKDALRQDIGMSVSAPSIEECQFPVISPHSTLLECSMNVLHKDLGMSVPTSSLEIVLLIDLVPKQVTTKVKPPTSFEHKGQR